MGHRLPLATTVRLSIRHKLFLTLLLATALVVAVMYGFMRWSFQQGYVRLVESRQQARLEQLAGRLGELYVAERGWGGLLDAPYRWPRLLMEGRGFAPDVQADRLHPGPGGPMGMHGGRMGRMLEGRLALLDADKSVLFGRVDDPGRLVLTPITAEGRAVGYVGMLPGPALSELVDVRFVEQQRRSFVLIALLVGLVSVALAWPLANTLVRPIERIAEGARALAAGRYGTRVPAGSRDELGELARDFNALAQALERIEQARRQWVADISHELRTPLSVLRGELEALQDGVRPLDQAAVASLAADVERLNRLVEDLYQLARSDLGTLSYRRERVDPVALLRDDVAALAGEFAAAGLAVSIREPVPGQVVAHADPDRLSQLWRNLLRNSLRYTDAGGRLEIGIGRQDGRLILDFQDTAPGVPESDLPHLFERFYRVEASRSRAHGGAGLGLAICRNIVAAHGGRIEARPSPLGGLWIRVELRLEP
jgi:two-component system sensor histidine kinase BaeS